MAPAVPASAVAETARPLAALTTELDQYLARLSPVSSLVANDGEDVPAEVLSVASSVISEHVDYSSSFDDSSSEGAADDEAPPLACIALAHDSAADPLAAAFAEGFLSPDTMRDALLAAAGAFPSAPSCKDAVVYFCMAAVFIANNFCVISFDAAAGSHGGGS